MNNMRGCSNCSIGTYQSEQYHTYEVCNNCTGKKFIYLIQV